MPSRTAIFTLLITVLAVGASGQAVISTHSGVVHYFEGAVTLNGDQLQPQLGKFASMASGSELSTAQGRAEVLLTPGIFLRLDQNSSIRMVSNSLADTRVELLSGSAMVEAGQPEPGTSATLSYKDWRVRFVQDGVYRLDSEPARLWVREGTAELHDPATGNNVTVDAGMDLPLGPVLLADKSTGEPHDALSNWSGGRSQSISADNAIAANIQDPATMNTDADGGAYASLGPGVMAIDPNGPYAFTQFPMLGLSPYIAGYGSLYPYQPGFYSLYLPGYTYRPAFIGMALQPRGPGFSSMPRYGVVGTGLVGNGVVGPGFATRPGSSIAPIVPRTLSPVIRPYPGTVSSSGVRPATPVVRAPVPVVRPAPVHAVGHR